MEKKEQLERHVEEGQQRYILPTIYGNPIDYEITGREVYDSKVANALIKKVDGNKNLIADKGYDSEVIRQNALDIGMNQIILTKSNTIKPNSEFDKHLYKYRHLVENLFARLQHFRVNETGFDKLAHNFRAMLFIASTIIYNN